MIHLNTNEYISPRDRLIYFLVNGDLDDYVGKLKKREIAEAFNLNPDRIYKIYNRVKDFIKWTQLS